MGRISTGGRRGTKPISVGRERLVIESNDPSVVQRFDDLFSGLPGDPVAPLISVTVDAVRDDQLGGRVHDWVYQTSVGDAVEVIDPDLRVHELWMTRFVNRRKLETEPDLLHLHSAAVARGNRAVLLVGRSGGGKSTLAAGLVRNGWDYVTDEQVTIVPRDLILRSYARPLTLRSEVWPQFRELPSVASVLRMNEAPERHLRVEVPPSEIGAVSAIAGLRSVVVFEPRRASGSPARSSAVADVAEALQMLAGTCYDSDRLGRSGIAALVEIACECPAWRLEYDGLDDASAEVERLFDQSTNHRRISARLVDPVRGIRPLRRDYVVRAPGACAWEFGDGSAVAVDPLGRRLARLDVAGLALWELLGEPVSLNELTSFANDAAAEAGVVAWVRSLEGSGFLRTAD